MYCTLIFAGFAIGTLVKILRQSCRGLCRSVAASFSSVHFNTTNVEASVPVGNGAQPVDTSDPMAALEAQVENAGAQPTAQPCCISVSVANKTGPSPAQVRPRDVAVLCSLMRALVFNATIGLLFRSHCAGGAAGAGGFVSAGVQGGGTAPLAAAPAVANPEELDIGDDDEDD